MQPVLPISPHDPAFAAFCVGRQMAYIGSERWRYTRALRLAPWCSGARMNDIQRAQWNALDLHPQTPAEMQARLDQLDGMESACLSRDNQMIWTIETAAMLANKPA
jgi:hypothetical protein